MSVSLHEHKLGGLRWIVLHGPDREAFGALGEHVRGELAGLAEAWPALPRLRRHVSGSPGRDLLAAVRRATAESFAAEWAELAAFADGAGVPFDDLALLRQATQGDSGLLDKVMRDVALLRPVMTIQPRIINSISLVASDGGNNRLEFNPFSLQVIRVVDTFGDELFLDVISPSTDAAALGQRHLDDPASPLGRMMRDVGASALGQLSPFIPAGPKSGRWPLVYRDLCEWAVLYDLVCHERWGSDTLIIRDGLLRTRIFAGDLFVRLYGLMKAAIEKKRREHRRQVFLVGIAKHSRIIERYRLAMAVDEVFPAGQACYAPVPPELQVKVYDRAEYVQLAGDDNVGEEKPRTNMGAMYLVRFGKRAFDPVWTMDLLQFQAPQAQQVFGSLLADAEVGFPVPCYPHCLQEADRYAQVVDLDLVILQSALEEAVREQIRADRRHVFDAQRLSPADPAAGRYQ